jgi:hypothetical protein
MLSADAPDLSTLSQADLFSLYRAILSELKGRGVIRTENAPAGDYAEYLVATAVGGQLRQLRKFVGRIWSQWRETAGESPCRVRSDSARSIAVVTIPLV